jgi:chromate transporter
LSGTHYISAIAERLPRFFSPCGSFQACTVRLPQTRSSGSFCSSLKLELLYSSGLAIVPFLHGGVVNRFSWLTERQFLDAVAVAMIRPGPVVITVAFIGYLVAGFAGASIAAAGTFLPCYLLVILPAPYFRRFSQNETIRAFVTGVTAAATGAIAGAAFVLGKRAIVDWTTAAVAVATLLLLVSSKKLPEAVLILVAGVFGVLVPR